MNVEVKYVALVGRRNNESPVVIKNEVTTALFRERRQTTPCAYQYEPNNDFFNFIVLHSCIIPLNTCKIHVGMFRNYRARYTCALLLTCQLNLQVNYLLIKSKFDQPLSLKNINTCKYKAAQKVPETGLFGSICYYF